MAGTGRQQGPLRPDWGPGWADLECDECAATWTGPLDEPCPWCDIAEERQRQWQGELLLAVELPDPHATNYTAAVTGWAARLRRGIEADIITEPQARRAWERSVDEVAP